MLSCWNDTLFCLESELMVRFRWFLLQLDSSSKFSRFLASPDNRTDCCPCTDCQVERGATLPRRRLESSQRDVPTPYPEPACPQASCKSFHLILPIYQPTPTSKHLGSLADPGSLLPGYLRARRQLDKSAPLGQTCKACDSI